MKKTNALKLSLRKQVVARLGKNELNHVAGASDLTCNTLQDTLFRTVNSAKGCFTNDTCYQFTDLFCQTRPLICVP